MLPDDPAQKLLLPFLKETEQLLRSTLQKLDPESDCQVIPAADLGFPHDAVRLAGGFPTGCFIEWKCAVPFLPVDATVNIDTSSIFLLNEDISDDLNESDFASLQTRIDADSSYVFNFHKGNHFISAGTWGPASQPVLVIHSNEKEFKYQYNGLMPHDGNWFMDRVKIHRHGDRYLRYIDNDDALLFTRIAAMLKPYNVIRHAFIANEVLSGRARVLDQHDWHHYGMPTDSSINVGCFLAEPGDVLPIFSRPGRNIDLFQCSAGGRNVVSSLNAAWKGTKLVVPHGWGKGCAPGTELNIDANSMTLALADESYAIRTLVSMGSSRHLELRNFDSDPESPESFYSAMKDHCPGSVASSIRQLASFSKNGFVSHADPGYPK